ncbi:hypothetical protein ACROYT_G034203 [Oculina patagonica]
MTSQCSDDVISESRQQAYVPRTEGPRMEYSGQRAYDGGPRTRPRMEEPKQKTQETVDLDHDGQRTKDQRWKTEEQGKSKEDGWPRTLINTVS